MIKPCIVVCWPRDTFYPLFVYQINRDRDLFGRVIVVMTEGNNQDFDFTKEIKGRIKQATVTSPDILRLTAGGGDWRNVAVNEALKYVKPDDYVLFLEQDFMVKEGFYKKLFEMVGDWDVIGVKDGNRFHPCCLLVKKKVIDKTGKDFSAYPPEGDHFQRFSDEIKKIAKWVYLDDLDLPEWKHISGLTYNYRIKDVFHKIDEFYAYVMGSDHELLDQPKEWRKFNLEKLAEIEGRGKLDEKVFSFFEEVKEK